MHTYGSREIHSADETCYILHKDSQVWVVVWKGVPRPPVRTRRIARNLIRSLKPKKPYQYKLDLS